MKKQIYTLFTTIVLAGVFAISAHAQSSGRTELIANIPFQFNVGDKTLPAAEYAVRQMNDDSEHPVLQLRNRDANAGVMTQMSSVIGKAPESPKLTFHRYGNKYFFAGAWVDGDTKGLQAPKSRAERAIQRELAGNKPTTETVSMRKR